MTVNVINPDSTILQQSQEHWMKYLSIVVWKLAPKGVTLTMKDFEEVLRRTGTDEELTLLTHGHYDSIEFKIVTRAEALCIAEHDAKQRGTG